MTASHRPALSARPPVRPRVGILGGGQLGHLLCQAARRLGLETVIVTPDDHAPALSSSHDAVVGAFDDPDVAAALIDRSDVVTFELEAIPQGLLDRLEAAELEGRIRVQPGVPVLRTLQNKAQQKAWMVENAIPTLPFRVLPGDGAPGAAAVEGFEFPLVQKTQRGGYDGQGVQVLRTVAELDGLWPVPSLIEPCLDERVEIAVVVARDASGATRCYAPVQMTFDEQRNILDTVVSPAQLPERLLDEAMTLGQRVVTALEGVGIFAIEMFVTPAGALLVNEISPRVHNAGHHTMESCAVSQFEQHLRAITGMALGSTDDERPATIRNLLYTEALASLHGAAPGLLHTADERTFVHWYGKRDARPWRKMGHITCLADDAHDARHLADAALAALTRQRPEGAA